MNRPAASLVPAFVLHRYPYRDSSFLVEVFSADTGRVGLVARGVRRPKSRWRGMLEPLSPLLLSWSGRGDLKTLTQAESAGAPIALRGEPLLAAFYVNELLLRLLARDDPHEPLFALYVETLHELREQRTAPALRRFEKRVLEALGYGVDFTVEAGGATPVESGRRYRVDPDAGPIPDPHGVDGEVLCQLADEAFDEDSGGDMRRILAALLRPHLGAKPMKTAALLRALRGFERGAGENDAAAIHSTGG